MHAATWRRFDSSEKDYFQSVVVGGLEVMSSNTRQDLSTSPEIRNATNSNFVNVILLIVFIRMPTTSYSFQQSNSLDVLRLNASAYAFLQRRCVIGYSLQLSPNDVNACFEKYASNKKRVAVLNSYSFIIYIIPTQSLLVA